MSGAGSVVCGSAMRMACSTLVFLSGHVHVLLYLQEDLREERQTQGRLETHSRKANLCPGMPKSCRKGLITFPLWLSHGQRREDTAEKRLGEKT